MVYVLLVLAILLLGAAVLMGVGTRRARMYGGGLRYESMRAPIQGLVEPVASLPPVLLPVEPKPADIEAVGFSLALRGYRCDQVDEVLDVLSAEIDRLHQVIAQHGKERVISNTGDYSE
ncbi:DivIVA domain-containing protein [Paeniglutamicibacter kerguelensis]|uniref:DivIVA domain-containing protein n=1 Tax=Paeniglutamicibacter kerguelensis TaxID=254788 RepID=A0ABS4XE65_9MICC|nr:DivIVA domain-containing protein [Paeniglutamicibacter kerguelensis]MBP2386759.1 DivIVA domain-containing protein [Paeniglutamicibacter kerguelensis]